MHKPAVITSLLSLGLTATPALANITPPPAPAPVGNLFIPTEAVAGFSITSLGEFIGAIMQLLFILAGVLVFVYLVWGGIQWLTSGGDSGSTQAARDRITAALVGLAIISISYALVILIQAFFGITIIGDNLVLPQPWS